MNGFSALSIKKKIPEIEGIRALAISMVLFYHFFSRWTQPNYYTNTYPYKFELAKHFSQYGYMGVQLFFMISGYVILSSLELQTNFANFAKARFRRIFPTLFIAIPFIYLVCNLLNQEFIAPIPLSSIIPSLTLLGPDFLNELFSTHFIWTTGVLWSLFVEIQFYLVAGALFFKLKTYAFITKLFVMALLMQTFQILIILSKPELNQIINAFVPLHNHIWWFLAGSTFFKIQNSKEPKLLLGIVTICFFFNLISLNYEETGIKINLSLIAILIIFYLIFFLLIKKPKIISLLSSSVLVWFGGISYEFYLIHESLGISLLSKMGQLNVFPNNVLLQIIVISLILSILIFFSLILKKMTKDSKQLIQYIVKIRSHL